MGADNPNFRPYTGEVLPPEQRGEVRMPSETPLGLGFLGAAKFRAIRRVLEARQSALRAIEQMIDAEGAVANAMVRREVAIERLLNLETIKNSVRNAIHFGYNEQLRAEEFAQEEAKIAKILQAVRLSEAEDLLAETKSRREKARGISGEAETPKKKSEYESFMGALNNIPGVVSAAKKVKADILSQAGGVENLSDEDQDLMSSVDAMLQEFIARQGEKAR